MNKENCFAFDSKRCVCTVLTETVCAKRSTCPFYKTYEQYMFDIAKSELKRSGEIK